MNWMRVYLIEMADLETRWMEVMENVNGDKKQQLTSTRSTETDEAGYGAGAETGAGSEGRLDTLDLEQE